MKITIKELKNHLNESNRIRVKDVDNAVDLIELVIDELMDMKLDRMKKMIPGRLEYILRHECVDNLRKACEYLQQEIEITDQSWHDEKR